MEPPRDLRTQQEIQDELRRKVEQATAELKRTKAERDRVAAISADVADTPDGALAVRQSMQLHRDAMRRLQEAILAFEAFNRNLGSR
jgi:predicted phage gp36 major capsid-like protein